MREGIQPGVSIRIIGSISIGGTASRGVPYCFIRVGSLKQTVEEDRNESL